MIIGDLDGTPVVATLDGSASAVGVVTLAAAIAAQLHTELVLLRVVRPLLPPLFRRPSARSDRAALDVRLIEQTDREIHDAERELCEFERLLDGACVSHVVLVGSRPAKRLINWLRSRRVALVVVSTPAQRNLRRPSHSDLGVRLLRAGVGPVLRVTCAATPTRRPAPRRPLRCRPRRWRSGALS